MKFLVLFILICIFFSNCLKSNLNKVDFKITENPSLNNFDSLNDGNNNKIDINANIYDYDSQINNFMSEINSSNKFILPDENDIINFDPDLLIRISFDKKERIKGVFEYNEDHIEFKPFKTDSFLIAKLNNNKLSKYNLYKVVLSDSPRHLSKKFENQVELNLVFKYNERFFNNENRIKDIKYLIISLPYAIKKNEEVDYGKNNENKNKGHLDDIFYHLNNGLNKSLYDNNLNKSNHRKIDDKEFFEFHKGINILQKRIRNKFIDKRFINGNLNITNNHTYKNNNITSTIQNELEIYFKDQIKKFNKIQLQRNINYSDNLLEDFIIDLNNYTHHNKNYSNFYKENIKNSTLSNKTSSKRNNYNFLSNYISNIRYINSLKKNRYRFAPSNDNKINFYFNEEETNSKYNNLNKISKIGEFKFKEILESFKNKFLYFEEPNLDDYSYTLKEKNSNLINESSNPKIKISNFVFVENNFISEKFFNITKCNLKDLKKQKLENEFLNKNQNDNLANDNEIKNSKKNSHFIKRFITFMDQKMLLENNDLINEMKFNIQSEYNNFNLSFENCPEYKISFFKINPKIIKKNFINDIKSINKINQNNFYEKSYSSVENSFNKKKEKINYSLKSFEYYMKIKHPEYFSRFILSKIYIKNYIIHEIIKNEKLSHLEDSVEIEHIFSKIFEKFFVLDNKKEEMIVNSKIENSFKNNYENILNQNEKIKIHKIYESEKNDILSNYYEYKTNQLIRGKKIFNDKNNYKINHHSSNENNHIKIEKSNEGSLQTKVWNNNIYLITNNLVKNDNNNNKSDDVFIKEKYENNKIYNDVYKSDLIPNYKIRNNSNYESIQNNNIYLDENFNINNITKNEILDYSDYFNHSTSILYDNKDSVISKKNYDLIIDKKKSINNFVNENQKNYSKYSVKKKFNKTLINYQKDENEENYLNSIEINETNKNPYPDKLKNYDNLDENQKFENKNQTYSKPLLKHQKIKYLNGTFVVIDTIMIPSDQTNIKIAKKKFQEIIDRQ